MHAMDSTVITSLQTRLINLRCGLKPGLAGKFACLLPALESIFLVWLYPLFSLFGCRYTEFGGPVPYRPAQDLAFAVARFIQKGGSFINYYMVLIYMYMFFDLNQSKSNSLVKLIEDYLLVLMVTVPRRNKFWPNGRWSFHCY